MHFIYRVSIKLYFTSHFSYNHLKIWFDILTPKDILFFESMVRRLEKKHTILCTSRNYREVNELGKIRNFALEPVGRFGGGELSGKLDASIDRMHLLSKKIQGFAPDLAISFCSPDAARISFGLRIRHIGFSNSPHSEAVMRLTVPFLTKLLIPSYITKKEFSRYGIDPKDIIKYNAMDELLIINNSDVLFELPKMRLKDSKTILFRTHESQAAYVPYHTDIKKIINSLIKNFKNYNIIIMGRYSDEIEDLKKIYAKQDVIILDDVVDGNAIFSITDVFIGSGGTMTTEAVLRKIPTISYEAVPSTIEKYLVRKKLLIRAKTSEQIVSATSKILSSENILFKLKSKKFVSQMSDPFNVLTSTINLICNS